ncbi:MAG: hypothetical protein LBI57_03385 [Helicobacteraceae bacterium]|jgi:hypothetical protein|nr:hypothetical protein [Helicobacteraceae bacterium]
MRITQVEADSLIKMDKFFNGDNDYEYPPPGDKLSVPLESSDKKENFIVDINRSYISLQKVNFQTRARKAIALVRVDIGGAVHRNPDGAEIQCPHIHIYKEGWGDKWAKPLPDDFRDPSDIYATLDDFLVYCRVVVKPKFHRGLLS